MKIVFLKIDFHGVFGETAFEWNSGLLRYGSPTSLLPLQTVVKASDGGIVGEQFP